MANHIAAIHVLKSKLALSDDDYRALLRTLTRRRDFGEISPRPGATRHTEAVDLVAQGRVLVEFWDTPGLEDAVGLEVELQAFPGTPTERLQQLLASPLAAGNCPPGSRLQAPVPVASATPSNSAIAWRSTRPIDSPCSPMSDPSRPRWFRV